MAKRNYLLLLWCFVPILCFALQHIDKNDLIVNQFNWKLNIPEFLVSENKEEWARVQDQGAKAIGKTYGIDVKNKATTVFVFRSKDQSFFEATSEPFKTGQNYIAVCEQMNDIFYNSIRSQIPGVKLDTVRSIVTIDRIPFQTLKSRLTFPGGAVKNAVVFRSLFRNTELTVSVMYSNEQTGNQIIDAFKRSNFHYTK